MKRYEVVSLTLNNLDNISFNQLLRESKEAISAFNAANPQETLLSHKLAELDPLLTQFEVLIHKSRRSQHSQALDEADKLRDQALLTLKRLLKAFSRVKDEASQTAYQNVMAVLQEFKGLEMVNYEMESEGIRYILKTLKEDSYQADLNQLHLRPHVTALAQAQKAFEKAYQARLSEQETYVPNQTRQLRRQLQSDYDAMVDYAALYHYLNPKHVAYGKLHASLNAIRSRYRPHQAGHKKATLKPQLLDGSESPAE